MSAPFIVSAGSDSILIRVKAVPGASRDEIAGVLGDRLKVRVSAPPEGGRANEAIVRLIEAALRLPRGSVEVEKGHASPAKQVRIRGSDAESAAVLGGRLRNPTDPAGRGQERPTR